jgi:hypothetical protein
LQLRKADYREQVLDVYDQVVGSPHGQNEKDWVQAKETIPDLESRYEEALGESLAAASKKRRETLESHRSRCIASV